MAARSGCVGLCELQYVIEAPAPQQGGIDLLGTIGGCQQHHTFYARKLSISRRSWLRIR